MDKDYGETDGRSRVQDSVKAAAEAWAKNPAKSGGLVVSEAVMQLRLPFLEDAHAVPNAFLRAALFPALSSSEKRPFVQEKPVFSVGSLRVTFTGEQFDQTDLDVLTALFEVGSTRELGDQFTFSAYSLLKRLGRTTGGKDYSWLHRALVRLRGGTIEVFDKANLFFGGFIEGGVGNRARKEYTIRINPDLGALFGFDCWSQVDREQRRVLGKNSTAKVLHGYYSSHVNPGAHRYEVLGQIVGLKSRRMAGMKRTLIKAHEALKSDECGFLTGFEAGSETILVHKAEQTVSQQRHARRRRPSKLPKNVMK